MRRMKKVLCFLLAVTLCISSANVRYVDAESLPSGKDDASEVLKEGERLNMEYEGEGYHISMHVESQWTNNYNTKTTITNTSEKPIRNWSISFVSQDEIENIWDADVSEHKESEYLIKNASYNKDIASGASVSFGFTAKTNGQIQLPDAVTLVSHEKGVNIENSQITYRVTSDWKSGFNGEIRIKNTSDTRLEDWTLEFDFENKVQQFWTAVKVSDENQHYIIKNDGYNANIEPGQEIIIGFSCDSGNAAMEPSNYKLTEVNGKKDEVPEEPVEPSKPERPLEPLEKIGEAYFKEPVAEDIILNQENGILYVKNQILISALPGVARTVLEEIADSVGAEIVGYIELTNDYQIEFQTGKTYEELETMGSYIGSFSFVDDASFNTVMEIDSDITTTDDPLYSSDDWNEDAPDGANWGLEALKVPSAWDYESQFQPVRVGLIDNMFDTNHEDLLFDQTFQNEFGELTDKHGTHVAGIMTGLKNNHTGISGVVTDSRLYAYASSNPVENMQTVMEYKYAFANLIGNRVKVINVSQNTGRLQCFAASHGNQNAINYVKTNAQILEKFLHKLILQGYDFVIVAAAGNVENLEYCVDESSAYGYRESKNEPDSSVERLSGNALAYYNSYLNAIELGSVKARIITVGSVGHTTSETEDGKTTSYSYSGFSNVGNRVDVCAPGEDIISSIPSNLPSVIGSTGYDRLSGTSMAAPYITGIAGMLYQANPGISAVRVKQIISSNANITVSDAHGNSYRMPDAEACVQAVQDSQPDNPGTLLPSGIVTGMVTNNNGTPLQGVKITAYRTSVGESNLEDYVTLGSTDVNGNYEIVLTQGTYSLNIYADGYLPCVIQNVIIRPDETIYMENLVVAPWIWEYFMTDVDGNVKNALNGKSIKEAAVKVRKGWNNTSGSYVTNILGQTVTAETKETGEFTMSLPIGIYTVEIKKNGFITGYYNVVSTTGTNSGAQTMVLTPVLSNDEYRIVLTWGDTPRDLDSHLSYYKDDVRKMHVYFSNKIGTVDGNTLAKLDLDDTTSYGPETVTITLNTEMLEGGVFKYSIHDFTNKSRSNSKILSLSGAVIRVYKGNYLQNTYNVPQNIPGTVWHVLEISENGIEAINKFEYNSDTSTIN